MNLKQLQYFSHLAKVSHFRRASTELYITQPTLSQSIASLEDELGVKLFEKHGRNVKLTDLGKTFLTYVEDSLEVLNNGVREMERLSNPNFGEVKFSFIYNLGVKFIPGLFNAFSMENPDANIYFSCKPAQADQSLEALKSRKVDFALSIFNEIDEDLESIKLMDEEVVFIAHNDHEILNKDEVDLEEVAKYPLVSFNRDTFFRKMADEEFKYRGIKPHYTGEVGEDMALIGLVSANQGIGIIPKEALGDNNNFVKIVPIKEKFYTQTVYILTLKNQYITPVAKKFLDFTIKYSEQYSKL